MEHALQPYEFDRMEALSQAQNQSNRARQMQINAQERNAQAQQQNIEQETDFNKLQGTIRDADEKLTAIMPNTLGGRKISDLPPHLRAKIFKECNLPLPFGLFVVAKETIKTGFFLPLFSIPYVLCGWGTLLFWYVHKNKIVQALFKARATKKLKEKVTYTLRDFIPITEIPILGLFSFGFLFVILLIVALTGGGANQ